MSNQELFVKPSNFSMKKVIVEPFLKRDKFGTPDVIKKYASRVDRASIKYSFDSYPKGTSFRIKTDYIPIERDILGKTDQNTGKVIPEDERRKIKFNLPTNNDVCVELEKLFTSIDEQVQKYKHLSDKKKSPFALGLPDVEADPKNKRVVPYKVSIYPIVSPPPVITNEEFFEKFKQRTGKDYDPETDDNRPNRFKAVLKSEILSDKTLGKILTKVHILDENNKRKALEFDNVDELAKYFKRGGKVRLLLNVSNIWLAHTPDKNILAGGFKIMIEEMLIQPPTDSSVSLNKGKSFFEDSDEEDKNNLVSNLNRLEETNDDTTNEKVLSNNDSDNDNDSGSDSDSDEDNNSTHEEENDTDTDTDSDNDSDVDEDVEVQSKPAQKAKGKVNNKVTETKTTKKNSRSKK